MSRSHSSADRLETVLQHWSDDEYRPTLQRRDCMSIKKASIGVVHVVTENKLQIRIIVYYAVLIWLNRGRSQTVTLTLQSVMLNEAKTWRPRPTPRPKIIMKKYQIMINNIWFKIIAGKINKFLEFYTIVCTKNARLHNLTTRSRPDRGQNLEAEAKASRPRPKFCLRGHFGLEDLTSLITVNRVFHTL